jgi:hypothetical protein
MFVGADRVSATPALEALIKALIVSEGQEIAGAIVVYMTADGRGTLTAWIHPDAVGEANGAPAKEHPLLVMLRLTEAASRDTIAYVESAGVPPTSEVSDTTKPTDPN